MRFIKYIILIFLGFLIYSNVLNAPFVFDDGYYIADNPANKYLSNFKNLYGTRYIGLLSFAINYYFGGLNTFSYHLVNVIIHILNAILVCVLVQLTLDMLKCRQWAMGNGQLERPITYNLLPIACSLIFLVHPVQTQAVSYITQRFTSLATLFYLLAIVLYVKARLVRCENCENRFIFYILLFTSYLSSIFAMKTKEISFTLPFVIVLYEFTFFRNNDSRHTTLNSRPLYLLPYLLTLIIIPLELFFRGEGFDQGLKQAQLTDVRELSKHDYLLTQFSVILTYIRLLFLPINQSFYYDYPIAHSIFEQATFLPFLFLLSIFVFSIYLYIRSRKTNNGYGLLISFGMLWFFITLSVESSIIPIKHVIFEHRLYLPSIGFILAVNTAVVYSLGYLENVLNRTLSIYLLSLFTIIVVIFLSATYNRNDVWKSELTLSMDEVKKSPSIEITHTDLGVVYAKQGLLNEAMKEYLTALKINPYYARAHNNLGVIYYKQGRVDESIKEYKMALILKPNYTGAYNRLGSIYSEQGRLDDALEMYLTALKFDPKDAGIYNNIGNIYSEQGLLDDALEMYLTALKFDPKDAGIYNNIGNIYSEQGLLDDAIKEYETAIRLNPDYADAHYNLVAAYYEKGRLDDAKREYLTATELKPSLREMHKKDKGIKR